MRSNPKVSLVTYHHVNNYGSVLQSLASQLFLQKHGCDVEIIDYVNEVNRDDRLLSNMVLDSKYSEASILKRTLFKAVNYPDIKKAIRVFDRFRTDHLLLTRRFFSSEEIEESPLSKYDAFCTGSDQVWNTHSSRASIGVDPAFFLDFAPTGSYKFSLSSSIGMDKLNHEEQCSFREYLSDYSAISVREKTAVGIISSLGLQEPRLIIDPTLLVESDYWRSIEKPIRLKQNYVLLYQLHDDEQVDRLAKKVAEKLGVPVLRVSFFARNRLKEKNIVYLPSPNQFLYLIDHASFVVTDSFHGTAFSTQFETPFISVCPSLFAGRIVDFLNLVCLSSRLYRDDIPIENYFLPIDWNEPKKRLDFERSSADEWMDTVVSRIRLKMNERERELN